MSLHGGPPASRKPLLDPAPDPPRAGPGREGLPVAAGPGREGLPVAVGPGREEAAGAGGIGREAALAELFRAQYGALLRLAVLLGADDAEDIVAEAFYQLYRRWKRLRSVDQALPYVRSVVVNLVRMRLRHLQVVRRHATEVRDGVGSAESEALLHDDQRALVAALKELPARQREALVLRYWLGLREAEIAAAMGISRGAVKSHTSRGMAALTRVLEVRR